jgi:hypothetical protein
MISGILKMLNQRAFAIVLGCNYYYAHVKLSEKCQFKEHGYDRASYQLHSWTQ